MFNSEILHKSTRIIALVSYLVSDILGILAVFGCPPLLPSACKASVLAPMAEKNTVIFSMMDNVSFTEGRSEQPCSTTKLSAWLLQWVCAALGYSLFITHRRGPITALAP